MKGNYSKIKLYLYLKTERAHIVLKNKKKSRTINTKNFQGRKRRKKHIVALKLDF